MSKICDICGKGYIKGNLVPRGNGDRPYRRTIRRQEPNLRSERFAMDNGQNIWLRVCTSCLKRLKFDTKSTQVSASA